MTRSSRVGMVLVALVLGGGLVAQAAAQIPGMPLFTNPRYSTGLRVHADIGQPTDSGTNLGDLTVAQAGVTFALGPLGLGANVGTNFNRARDLAGGAEVSEDETFTGSALAQIRLAGGGRQNLSLSLFGGASADITTRQVVAATLDFDYPRLLTVPVGGAVGLRIPLGLTSLNVWGAPRMVMTKYVNCPDADPTGTGYNTWCDESNWDFRWAAGVDLPILGILSLRAAYDSGKIADKTVSYWGVGASIGIGGMR